MKYTVEICRETLPPVVYARSETLQAAVDLMVPLTDRYRWLRVVDQWGVTVVEKYDVEPHFDPKEPQ